VFQARIEAAGPLLDAEGYPMITARAVAPLHRIIPWCAPHLSDGGLLVGFQGNRAPEALEEARGAMKRHGLKPVDVIPYSLPGKGSPRHIVLLQKTFAP
jgi:16S rRNA (guanine527-N7)-methyltransferase